MLHMFYKQHFHKQHQTDIRSEITISSIKRSQKSQKKNKHFT